MEIVNACRVLGCIIGSDKEEKKLVERSQEQQKSLLKKLSIYANLSPQNVFKSFASSVRCKLTFLARTKTKIGDLPKEDEIIINDELLRNLLKNPAHNQKYGNIFLLPIWEGGLNILKPDDRSKEYERSVQLSRPLSLSLPKAELKQQQIVQEMNKERNLAIKSKNLKNKSRLNKNVVRSLNRASEK